MKKIRETYFKVAFPSFFSYIFEQADAAAKEALSTDKCSLPPSCLKTTIASFAINTWDLRTNDKL